MINKKLLLLLSLLSFFFGSIIFVSHGWSKDSVDHTLFALLLEKYVKDGFVDYEGFKDEENQLDLYLKVLETTETKSLDQKEQFAFYINAYNAWTIKLILGRYPKLSSIKDLGTRFKSPWKEKFCRIDKKTISLDTIEHKILRKRFKDPRVHFAINCAAKSCPPLISKPYRKSSLEQQLNDSTQAFINDPMRNRLEGDTLYVSRIFKWFEKDFNGDVLAFFLKYAAGEFKKELQTKREKIKIKYLDYDWSLNGT